MNTVDKIYLQELITKGEKIEAIKLVMQQTNMHLSEAKEYVDNYCRQEKIGDVYSGPNYSATNEGGSVTYYKTENGEKQIISKGNAPEFLVEKMESATHRTQIESPQQNNVPNHKKGRRILTYMSLPCIALCIYFLYQICINKVSTFDSVGGAIASGIVIISIYFIELMLWLDESTARRRKRKVEEMEVPYSFTIEGKRAKRVVLFFDLLYPILCAMVLAGSVMMLIEKEYLLGIFLFVIFLFSAYITWAEYTSYFKNVKLSLHISGDTIRLYQENDELATLPVTTTTWFFSTGRKWSAGPYPRVCLRNTDNTQLATIFLDLPEYHMLKKYLLQQGASVTDNYNRY